MSLISAVLSNLETKLRTAIPSLPVGTLGVERAWRPTHELQPGALPHVFLWNLQEQPERLIHRQIRVSVSFTGLIVRRGSTHDQALADYDALLDAIEAEPSMGGSLEQAQLGLDGLESEEGGNAIGVLFSFSGRTVLL